MNKRHLAYAMLLLGFLAVSIFAPSLALACPHMKKAEQSSSIDSDCPMHKKEEKKIDLKDKPCCNSASCKIPHTLFTNISQLYSQLTYLLASLTAANDAHAVLNGPDIITPPPRSILV